MTRHSLSDLNIMYKNLHKIILLFFVLLVVSCNSDKAIDANKKDPPAEELYDAGKKELDEGHYKKAIENFKEIERLYPFSKLAGKSQVMSAYASYKDEEFEDAIATIENYIKFNPGNSDVPYMYYLKALSYYDRIADVKRDQKITENALESLIELEKRYPNSKYARDARLKIDLVRDHLAGKEMEIGRFYLKKKKFIAAINRFQEVIKNFQTTSHVPEALYRLTETYLSIGIVDEAKKNAAVLGHNYPESKWYKFAYRLVQEGKDSPTPEEKKSWLKEMFTFEGKGDGDLPKTNEADSWFDDLRSLF